MPKVTAPEVSSVPPVLTLIVPLPVAPVPIDTPDVPATTLPLLPTVKVPVPLLPTLNPVPLRTEPESVTVTAELVEFEPLPMKMVEAEVTLPPPETVSVALPLLPTVRLLPTFNTEPEPATVAFPLDPVKSPMVVVLPAVTLPPEVTLKLPLPLAPTSRAPTMLTTEPLPLTETLPVLPASLAIKKSVPTLTLPPLVTLRLPTPLSPASISVDTFNLVPEPSTDALPLAPATEPSITLFAVTLPPEVRLRLPLPELPTITL